MTGAASMPAAAAPPLVVVGLGGNAISPPHGDLSVATERALIATADSLPRRRAARYSGTVLSTEVCRARQAPASVVINR